MSLSKAQQLNTNLARLQSPPVSPLKGVEHKPFYTMEDVAILHSILQYYRLLTDPKYLEERLEELSRAVRVLQREGEKLQRDAQIAPDRLPFLIKKLLIVEEEAKQNEVSVRRLKAAGLSTPEGKVRKRTKSAVSSKDKPTKKQQQDAWLLGLLKAKGMDVSKLEGQLGVKVR